MQTKVVKFRRGTTVEHQFFTGAEGELSVDTDKNTLVVHDGTTVGGFPLKVEAATYDRRRYLTMRAAITQRGIPSLGFSSPENSPEPIVINEAGIISGAAAFRYQAGQSVQDHFMLPQEFVTPMDLEILWRSSQTIGRVDWRIQTCGIAIGESLATAEFNAIQTVESQVGGIAYELMTHTITGLHTTNMVPNGECFFKFSRSAVDTLTSDAELIALRFVVRVRGK